MGVGPTPPQSLTSQVIASASSTASGRSSSRSLSSIKEVWGSSTADRVIMHTYRELFGRARSTLSDHGGVTQSTCTSIMEAADRDLAWASGSARQGGRTGGIRMILATIETEGDFGETALAAKQIHRGVREGRICRPDSRAEASGADRLVGRRRQQGSRCLE